MLMKENLYDILSADNKSTEKLEELNTFIGGKPLEETIAYQRAVIKRMNEEIEGLKQDRKQRKIFGYCIFGFMCSYMAAAIVIVFFCGFGLVYLSDKVISILIGSTLVEVIGIFTFVARYLFHQKD